MREAFLRDYRPVKFALIIITILLSSCDKHQKRETHFSNGKSQESFEVLETENGNFVNDGQYNSWYEGGQTRVAGTYLNGKKNGNWKYFFENGQIQFETNYKIDTLDGQHIEWYRNGKKKIEANYSHGHFIGKVNSWYENGSPCSAVEFNDHGRSHGQQSFWYENGKKGFDENWANGIPVGTFKYWGLTGSLVAVREFKNGVDQNLPASYSHPNYKTLFIMLKTDGSYTRSIDRWGNKENGKFQVTADPKGVFLKFNNQPYPLLKFSKDSIVWEDFPQNSIWVRSK